MTVAGLICRQKESEGERREREREREKERERGSTMEFASFHLEFIFVSSTFNAACCKGPPF